MKPFEVAILIFSVVVVSSVQNPLSDDNNNPENLSGSFPLEPSFKIDDNNSLKARSCFNLLDRSTFTVILSTVTSTTTLTTVTTCTTSTASLKPCTTTGRRRRDVESRGFLNNENEETRGADGLMALSPSPTENGRMEEQSGRSHENDVGAELRFVIDSSLTDPSVQAVRFVDRYGTFTVTPTVTQTSTRTLTATCSSTTGYKTCGASGK